MFSKKSPPLLRSCRAAGTLHTHGSLAAHMHALLTSWKWHQDDRILHCLPLHHVHGIINALYCAHAVGATVEFQPKFSPTAVWAALMVRCHHYGVQTSVQH
jgi:malonyl-CoA/methylmalonyl-CoA synthetase